MASLLQQCRGKIINHNQLCGIETYICDNGDARGSRIAWVNTGSGFRFKVAIDRGLDIVDAFYGPYSLAWLSHRGSSAPRPDLGEAFHWLSNFSGGLVTTCGLSHFGGPEQGHGLHGKYSGLSAQLESVIQPCLCDDEPVIKISGTMRETAVFGPNLELKRTITAFAGQSKLMINDTVYNLGNTDAPLMLLYHCNFGWPLVDEGSEIFYDGQVESRGSKGDNAIFNDGSEYKKCLPPQESHNGTGEACGFITPQAGTDGLCTAGIKNPKLGITAQMKFKNDQLPCLTNWQHWGRGEYVTGIEPGTNYPIGQAAAKEQNALTILKPGEKKDFELMIEVVE
jgi:hypothetical protein